MTRDPRNGNNLNAADRRLLARRKQRVRQSNVYGGLLVAVLFLVCSGASMVIMAYCEPVDNTTSTLPKEEEEEST
eukprot:CAMPEP_0172456500 /NCGR_PEP_ID=MMETSP1065-20121228/16122_1 /TAXON_ID=265537 /ORGANISM="Amphiprora paludosa, Strain CCMP125" /LENGTH=74 /DNA_ID=CAMNT_0013209563 /DNA_START=18 /DNA_END=242 /DNA_ORIENTATION=+